MKAPVANPCVCRRVASVAVPGFTRKPALSRTPVWYG